MGLRIRQPAGRHNDLALRPAVEGMESRHLLSALPGITFDSPITTAPIHIASGGGAGGSGGGSSGGGSGGAGGGRGGSVGGALGGANASPPVEMGTPTPRELRRELFKGGFVARFFHETPRFTDESKAFSFVGIGGTNQFLHGNLQMKLFTPTDPAGTVVGTAGIFDRNNNSGGSLLLFLSGNPTDVDRAGRPTLLHFNVNGGGGSGGTYSSSVGEGTVKIQYFPGRHAPGRPYHGEAGTANVRVQGLIFTTGTNTNVESTLRL